LCISVKCDPDWRPDCEVKPELRYAMYIMLVGQFFIGASLAAFYTLGFTYLDQSVSNRSTAIYFSTKYFKITQG